MVSRDQSQSRSLAILLRDFCGTGMSNFDAVLLSPLTKYQRVSNMDLNETEQWEIFKFEFVAYPRIWLFGNVVDGIWILLPIAVFGTIVNSFLVR